MEAACGGRVRGERGGYIGGRVVGSDIVRRGDVRQSRGERVGGGRGLAERSGRWTYGHIGDVFSREKVVGGNVAVKR